MSLNNKKITIIDPTLRDGSHANQHQFTKEDIEVYCRAVSQAGVSIVRNWTWKWHPNIITSDRLIFDY